MKVLRRIIGCWICHLCLVHFISAQSFERVERLAGLGILQENSGVAVADYDGDRDLDIFVMAKAKDEPGRPKTISRLFRNNDNGTFTDVTEEAGLTGLLDIDEFGETFLGLSGFKYGVSWGDYDNDGFPDLFFTHVSKVQLFHNQGNGTFTEVTQDAGIWVDQDCKNTGATWFDFDKDGWLDIYINDWGGCRGNSLFRNRQDGTFQRIDGITGPVKADGSSLQSYMMLPFDFNHDGWLDMYVTNDFREPNTLYINQQNSKFEESAAVYGLDNRFDDMGVATGDFNQDGDFDLFITGIRENRLFSNNGNGTYTDLSEQSHLAETGWGWGAVFADFDHDTDEDLFVTNGFSVAALRENNVYFQNLKEQGGEGFERTNASIGLGAATMSTEAIPFDFDNDGDLDLFVSNSDQASFLYENKLINAGEAAEINWLKVSLVGTESNRAAFGAVLRLDLSNGKKLMRSYSGVGFLSQSIQPVHFGISEGLTIEQLSIQWPSGHEETYRDLDVNTWVEATEKGGVTSIEKPSSQKTKGCTDPRACNFNPLATASSATCQYLASSSEIFGPAQSAYHREETYTYLATPGSEVIWTIGGGEIIEGQGTRTVRVRWGFGAKGTIGWFERNEDCESEAHEKEVQLNFGQLDLENLSMARIWNEALLEAIRGDFARPNVHARNLFHLSIAAYDAWAIHQPKAKTYLMGNRVQGFLKPLQAFIPSLPKAESVNKAISYASFRLLSHRFAMAPDAREKLDKFELIMNQLGYDPNFESTDYTSGDAAALGNYIAQSIIEYGLQDGSREEFGYDYAFYQPANEPLDLSSAGIDLSTDPNRWQPLKFRTFVDQSGNLFDEVTPKFLGPEWGAVSPFALTEEQKQLFQRDGFEYNVYHDPGLPPQLQPEAGNQSNSEYQWNFALVAQWSAQLDPNDGVMWDISPGSIGNTPKEEWPVNLEEYQTFYEKRADINSNGGHQINLHTGMPYAPQMVPRGDYTRVLAEFWADGPDSETPPGHWFTLMNYVSDHSDFERKFKGTGEVKSPLEWDVKAYLALGGAMHDAAIAAWSVKGWYDYIRPISAIRYMSALGQSSDPSSASYHPAGIPLKAGLIELVNEGEPMAGHNGEHVGKIKLFAWLGHERIANPATDEAGVGWILAENWWPYQRPSFVTPPFAGYVSGHSTFSRAAAEVLTLLTGDPFFPGGMGEFVARKNEFLVFEKGPSVDVVLQWATYRDASDQTSLSRIWGGIHPPVDDIPGREIGEKVGIAAFELAASHFGETEAGEPTDSEAFAFYPNPVSGRTLAITNTSSDDIFSLHNAYGAQVPLSKIFDSQSRETVLRLPAGLRSGLYVLSKNDQSKTLIIQ